jgi:hypothetical protein
LGGVFCGGVLGCAAGCCGALGVCTVAQLVELQDRKHMATALACFGGSANQLTIS